MSHINCQHSKCRFPMDNTFLFPSFQFSYTMPRVPKVNNTKITNRNGNVMAMYFNFKKFHMDVFFLAESAIHVCIWGIFMLNNNL